MVLKNGDDLRQDQLVLQMITLMDKVLRAFGLDLKFTIYKCLATGSEDGLMEFVEGSQTIQKAR
jgi:phosphatidylinositol 3-kinase